MVRIDLRDGRYGFARVLPEPLFGFYDNDSKDETLPNLHDAEIFLKLWVMNRAVTTGRWEVVGHKPLTDELKHPPDFFKQDALTGKLFVYREGTEIPASFEECSTLERAAVWDPEHVEDRLRDHFDNLPNKWVESLKISGY